MKNFIRDNLIILLALSFFIIPSSFSVCKKMVSGNSNLALARWHVALNQGAASNYLSITTDPNGQGASYTVNITSTSEVDVGYSIVIENLPTGVSVKLDENANYVSEDNHVVIFPNIGTISYNDSDKNREHTLTFKAGSTASAVSNQEVNINVIVKQII